MLDKIFKIWLRFTGKKYLVPFVDGLVNSGRPSDIFFPMELVEQGLSLAMGGLNNTMALQGNLNWIWPVWYEMQRNPDSPFFQATGANMMTANLTLRNWTSLGNPDSEREIMVDPVGMLTPAAWGWSVFPYLRLDSQSYYPPRLFGKCKQEWGKRPTPVIRTSYDVHPDLDWKSEISCFAEHGNEFADFSHIIRNNSNKLINLTLGISLRPYNSLTMGHINKIAIKKQLWRINGEPAIILPEEANRHLISDRFHGDPLLRETSGGGTIRHSSKSGITSGISEWDLEIRPGEEVRLETPICLHKENRTDRIHVPLFTRNWLKILRGRSDQNWDLQQQDGMQIQVPDPEFMHRWKILKKHLLAFDDQTHFSPGTFIYHLFWIRDSFFIGSAFEGAGLHRYVRPKIEKLLATQKKNGYFCSQDGEWDSNGQAIRILTDHCILTGDRELANKIWPSLMKAAQWTESKRSSPHHYHCRHAGLLPAGFSAEHFGPSDHYFWDNFWNLSGLEHMIRLGAALGKDLAWLRALADTYRHDIKKVMRTAMDLNSGSLPASVYRQTDSASIGNMIAVAPLDLFPADSAWVRKTAEHLIQHSLHQNMFFQKIIHTGLNTYLSIHLAHVLMLRGDQRWREIHHSVLQHASATYTWPEAVNPRTGGGCMGDGDHGWAAADVFHLKKRMLTDSHHGQIILGAGVDSAWIEQGKIAVADAPTLFGNVNWSLQKNNETLEISWKITRNELQSQCPVALALPEDYHNYAGVRNIPGTGLKGLIFHRSSGKHLAEKAGQTYENKASIPAKYS